jgi:hypothetical protein
VRAEGDATVTRQWTGGCRSVAASRASGAHDHGWQTQRGAGPLRQSDGVLRTRQSSEAIFRQSHATIAEMAINARHSAMIDFMRVTIGMLPARRLALSQMACRSRCGASAARAASIIDAQHRRCGRDFPMPQPRLDQLREHAG